MLFDTPDVRYFCEFHDEWVTAHNAHRYCFETGAVSRWVTGNERSSDETEGRE